MKSPYVKQTEAKQRLHDRAKRSDAEQIQLIHQRPGKSAREMARIAARVAVAGRADLTPHGEVAAPVVQVKTKKRLKKAA